jgi:hypothetical protein
VVDKISEFTLLPNDFYNKTKGLNFSSPKELLRAKARLLAAVK